MNKSFTLLLAVLLIAGCTTEKETETDQSAADQSGDVQKSIESDEPGGQPAQKRDISTEALVKIDPEIRRFADAVEEAKENFEKSGDVTDAEKVVKAHVEFGDYMTYESIVSPQQGKYHRALIEYRHAMKLDPHNQKVQDEIIQIEDIYNSMGRPIPDDGV